MREEIFAFVVHDKVKIKVSHDNFHFFYLLFPRASNQGLRFRKEVLWKKQPGF
jgi:hypothetical protein